MVHTPQHALDEIFWRKRILPEEDRRSRSFRSLWNGSYRWFRSPNIVTFGTIAARPRNVASPILCGSGSCFGCHEYRRAPWGGLCGLGATYRRGRRSLVGDARRV